MLEFNRVGLVCACADFMGSSLLRAMCSSVPGRYAFALFQVALEIGELERVLQELYVACALFERGCPVRIIVLRIFQGKFKPAWCGEFIKVLGFLDATINFLFLLANNKREDCLPDITRLLKLLVDDALNRESVIVYTANNVSESDKQQILEKLLKIFKKELNLSFEIDEEILGGLVARSNTVTIDASVRHQIEKLA
jgi:F-type H+-transporting ATPase subunit delta